MHLLIFALLRVYQTSPVPDKFWTAVAAGERFVQGTVGVGARSKPTKRQLDVATAAMVSGADCGDSSPCWPLASSSPLPPISDGQNALREPGLNQVRLCVPFVCIHTAPSACVLGSD